MFYICIDEKEVRGKSRFGCFALLYGADRPFSIYVAREGSVSAVPYLRAEIKGDFLLCIPNDKSSVCRNALLNEAKRKKYQSRKGFRSKSSTDPISVFISYDYDAWTDDELAQLQNDPHLKHFRWISACDIAWLTSEVPLGPEALVLYLEAILLHGLKPRAAKKPSPPQTTSTPATTNPSVTALLGTTPAGTPSSKVMPAPTGTSNSKVKPSAVESQKAEVHSTSPIASRTRSSILRQTAGEIQDPNVTAKVTAGAPISAVIPPSSTVMPPAVERPNPDTQGSELMPNAAEIPTQTEKLSPEVTSNSLVTVNPVPPKQILRGSSMKVLPHQMLD
jgi:hypothetical protein